MGRRARGLTQEFFARFIARQHVKLADASRGRFRSFLLTSLKDFLLSEWAKTQAARRGGGLQTISWEEQDAEARLRADLLDELTPARVYERRWALNYPVRSCVIAP